MNKQFYKDLIDVMCAHDMLYNEYVDTREKSPLYAEHFNILQSNIIAYIKNKGDLTMNQLAKIVKVLPTNLSPMVKELEQRDWLRRYRKEGDKRFVYVGLSEGGRKKINVHSDCIIEHLENTLKGALTEEEEIDFNEIYGRLVKYFEKLVVVNESKSCDK